MTDKRIIILNCPPRTGKDTIADLFVKDHPNSAKHSFKDRLFKIALTVSNIPEKEWFTHYHDNKDIPWERLGGLTQRQYLIRISEEWVKPTHGKDYFGYKLLEDIQRDTEHDTIIIPDGGFEDEISPLVANIDTNNILILQWTRGASNFDDDSRDWITNYPSITKRVQDNNDSIPLHYQRVLNEIDSYYYYDN